MIAPEIQDLELVLTAVRSDIRAIGFVEDRLLGELKAKLGIHHIPSWAKPQAPSATKSERQSPGAQRWVMPNLKQFYDILGVSESATPDEVKKEYRKLAL